MPETTTNTRTLPQLPHVALLDELFEKGRIDGGVLGFVSKLLARWRDITDQMRADDEQRSRLLLLRRIDAEFAHTVVGEWCG